MVRAVIFDLDNTLIDFSERMGIVIREVVKAMLDAGLPGRFEDVLREFSMFYWTEGIEDQQILQKFLTKRYGEIDYRVLAHAILAYRRVNTGLLRPYPGAKRMLRSLRSAGYKMAILSDAPRLEAYLRLCSVGFDDYFDVILTKDDIGALKPEAKCFKLAAERLGIPPEECAMVGDRPERDIAGAGRLGMTTIFARYGCRDGAACPEADFTAEGPEEIVKCVQKGA